MGTRRTLLLCILGIALLGAACGAMGSIDLAGTRWRLIELDGHAPLGAGTSLTLNFETRDWAGGNSGCNIYSSTYRITGATIAFSDLASTARACLDPALNEQEAEFYQMLGAVTSLELAGGELLLKDGNGATRLRFVRE
ncbi:MAG: META domain-containing protein [Roseiflexaceae bacterium]|nr:META domain-containing protein [Roseiflexaceae bacterium]